MARQDAYRGSALLHFTVRSHGVRLAAAILASSGCFSERSFPLTAGDVARLHSTENRREGRSARQWLTLAHRELRGALPWLSREALLTENLADVDGRPIDVRRHFGLAGRNLAKLLCNSDGLSHTAQAAAQGYMTADAKSAPGFEDIWVPISNELKLAGRMGWATDADSAKIKADCIVILPGFFGDNGIQRTRDLATGLKELGFHVLALELRGHGRTDASYPSIPYNFGVLETGDLLAVSEWLRAEPLVDRTGLVGFCWGANSALLAAWSDGRGESAPDISERLSRSLRPVMSERHYEAGIIAFSPVLRFEELIDALDSPRETFHEPVLAALQNTIRLRMERKHDPPPDGSLRRLIDLEFARSALSYPHAVEDGLRFLRFLPYRDKPIGAKLAAARTPVLIVAGANDPLTSAQDLADLLAGLDNPNVAGLILPGGGHVGFAAYAKRYYFSLIVNFFDRRTGPSAVPRGAAVAQAD